MLLVAPPGTQLWDARFAVRDERPCGAGPSLSQVEAEGNVIPQGPLDVGGEHELELSFGASGMPRQAVERWNKSRSQPAYVDLSLEVANGERSCARVALFGDPSAPRWQLAGNSPGIFISVLGRAYPLGIASKSAVMPNGGLGERFGAAFGATRAWVEVGAAFTASETSNQIVLATGADEAFWHNDRWSLRAGLGYDVALNFYRPDPQRPGTLRYTFHGPRASLGASYSLIRNMLLSNFSTHPSLPAENRTLSLEFEVPVSVWFGTGAAPRTSLVPGVGMGIFWAF